MPATIDPSPRREHWGSRLGFILAAAGSAIGLGNIWRFPYVTGVNGGALFLLVYLVMIGFIGYPLFVNEMIIGRKAQKDPVGAFRALAPHTPWWLVGGLGVFTGFVILSYYSVVAGWSLAYTWRAFYTGFGAAADHGAEFGALVAAPGELLKWHGLFMLLCMAIIAGGIERGIERWAKILMPVLLVLMLVLIARAVTLPGAGAGILYFLKPDPGQLSFRMLHEAVAQSFFTLSLGMGAIITYGSYLSDRDDVPGEAFYVVGLDTVLAVLAGFMIFPAVFAFGLEPGAGPGLTFITLPNVFASMAFGRLFGAAFFLLLSIAALTSAISLLETVVAYLVDEKGVRRDLAALLLGGVIFLVGIPPVLGYSHWSDWRFLGEMDVLDTYDWFANKLFLPAGALLASVFSGYVWKVHAARAEANRGAGRLRAGAAWGILIRYVIPAALAVIIAGGLISTFLTD